jgi:hypothetical protein
MRERELFRLSRLFTIYEDFSVVPGPEFIYVYIYLSFSFCDMIIFLKKKIIIIF